MGHSVGRTVVAAAVSVSWLFLAAAWAGTSASAVRKIEVYVGDPVGSAPTGVQSQEGTLVVSDEPQGPWARMLALQADGTRFSEATVLKAVDDAGGRRELYGVVTEEHGDRLVRFYVVRWPEPR